MGLDPMTVVIVTNNLGEIVRLYTDLPLRFVKIDGDGNGGTLDRDGLLSSIPAAKAKAVERCLDRWGHLSVLQREKIHTVAVDEMTATTAEEGLRRSLISGFADDMSVTELLDRISEDDDELAEKLGFDPDTGEDVVVEGDVGSPAPHAWAEVAGVRPAYWHLLAPDAYQPENPPNAAVFAAHAACGASFTYARGKKRRTADVTPGGRVCPMCAAEAARVTVWVRTKTTRTWHVLAEDRNHADTENRNRTGHMACGARHQRYLRDTATAVAAGLSPPAEYDERVCAACLAAAENRKET